MNKLFIFLFLLVSQVVHAQKATTVKMVSTNRVIHRFFDTSPISPSGKYLALFRFPDENKSPKPGDAGDVILVKLKTGKEKVVAQSRGFEMQLGANVQWGATDKELIYNDVDTSTWNAYAICLNPLNGESRKLGGTVFMVSNDGKKIVSYNLVKSSYAQVGYGVVVPNNKRSRNMGLSTEDGISVTDVATGTSKLIVSIKKIYEESVPSIAINNPEEFEFYCFQAKWNPQGTKILTTIQWSKAGVERRRAVITMDADGSNIRTAVTPDQWAKGGHHVNWMPDGEHLSMNLETDGEKGLEVATFKYDGTDLKVVFKPGSGHPSFHPKGLPFAVTDAYAGEMPLKNDESPIRLLNTATGTETLIYSVYLPPIKNFEFRIDAHPAWDRTGRFVVFNGSVNGTRSVFVADVKKMLK
jgi:hypothetical protein